jgi:hypothetical protein
MGHDVHGRKAAAFRKGKGDLFGRRLPVIKNDRRNAGAQIARDRIQIWNRGIDEK